LLSIIWPFEEKNEKLYQDNNGKFLVTIEMIAEFDTMMQEHIRHIQNDEIHHHYLGHNIRNELICLIVEAIRRYVLSIIKGAKYFFVILDYTPDAGHDEQMTTLLEVERCSANNPKTISEAQGLLTALEL
jgi:hypothetical protein